MRCFWRCFKGILLRTGAPKDSKARTGRNARSSEELIDPWLNEGLKGMWLYHATDYASALSIVRIALFEGVSYRCNFGNKHNLYK